MNPNFEKACRRLAANHPDGDDERPEVLATLPSYRLVAAEFGVPVQAVVVEVADLLADRYSFPRN